MVSIVLTTISVLLIDDEGVARPVTLVAMALLGSPWSRDACSRFPTRGSELLRRQGGKAENDTLAGVGSLRRRDPDVQSARSVVGSGKVSLPGYRADFRDAEAEFKGANLTGVDFDYAELGGATYDRATTWPAGFFAPPDRTVIQ